MKFTDLTKEEKVQFAWDHYITVKRLHEEGIVPKKNVTEAKRLVKSLSN